MYSSIKPIPPHHCCPQAVSRSETVLKTHPLSLKIPHSPPSLKQPMTEHDGHHLHCAFPFLSGPCPAAARGFPWLLEASIHLLFAANTKGSRSKPVNPDQQRRCPEQVAEVATSEDRQTDNQTHRQHHQTPSTTPRLRRGAACSTRDVVALDGDGQQMKEGFVPPSKQQA